VQRTLVDSNVLLDLFTEDDEWFDWSSSMIERCADAGELLINPIIYAEVSPQFDTLEELDEVLTAEYFRRASLPWEAGFLAGRAFLKYRRAGGVRRSPLPDFYIGAHAAIEGLTLLTRDPGRYRKYFRKLRIISP
jgi:predicted nucleic acid-binding protein